MTYNNLIHNEIIIRLKREDAYSKIRKKHHWTGQDHHHHGVRLNQTILKNTKTNNLRNKNIFKLPKIS